MYALDERRDPLIILSVDGEPTMEQAQRIMDDVDMILERNRPFALIYDISAAATPPRNVVKAILDWNRDARERYAELYERPVDAPPSFTAYYMGSPMLRGLLRFFLQMMPAVRTQVAVCTSLTEAVTLAERAMARAGVDVPHLEDHTQATG